MGAPSMPPIGSEQNNAFIFIGDNTREVIIESLDLQGHDAVDDEIFGIIVSGKNIRKILIRNNKIHNFSSNSNAHGIAVYGTGDTDDKAIRHVIIDGNSVYSMRTGSSESVVINGNVSRWEIKRNDIYDVNNIAIDAIGGEGTTATRTDSQGRILPGIYDVARYGFIEDNFVENMSSIDNPAYNNEESWAAAIYIDGGSHIQITDNVVVNASWAYELGAENCLTTRHITMTGNSAVGSTFGDLLLGGYTQTGYLDDASIDCNPNNTIDVNEGHGYVKFLTVKENHFNSTNVQIDPIFLQYRTTNTIIVEPGVIAENEDGDGSAPGDENAVRIDETNSRLWESQLHSCSHAFYR